MQDAQTSINDPKSLEVESSDHTTAYAAQLHFDVSPTAFYQCQRQFKAVGDRKCPNTNFLKGVKWSPDGACLLTASDDNSLHIFDLPSEAYNATEIKGPAHSEHDSFSAALQIQEGELVYDYAWYSGMHTSDSASCCFATTSRAHPIHLWDACTGGLRCVYRAYDAADEITAAYSIAFNRQGSHIWAGYNKAIRVFDLSRPGRDCQTITTFQKGHDGQPGIISCMDFSPDDPNMMAAGSYSSDAAVYDVASGSAAFILSGHKGGITQVKFSADGNFLYTGARKDPDILCWDVRHTSGIVYRLQRDTADTNQRIQFDIEPVGRHLATGGVDGKVANFDLSSGEQVSSFQAAGDTVNGFHFHPYLPLSATASGHRRYPLLSDDDDSNPDYDSAGFKPSQQLGKADNSLRVWQYKADWLQAAVAQT